MKHTIKYLIIFSVGCLLNLTSCSDNWLETSSTQSADGKDMFSTTDNAKLVINGICKTMVQQHGYYGQSFNGEGTMKLIYGEYPGQDFNDPYMTTGWDIMMNHTASMTQSSSSIYDAYPWYYYYLIVGNANAVIRRIDAAEGTQAEKEFLKAEALTFRAYSFFRLTEIYCDSWAKDPNGTSNGIVLRLDEIKEAGQDTDMPLSTLAQTYKRIYDDLDEALTLYQSSGLTRETMYSEATSQVCFPDASVAHAIYARVALTKKDYDKALSEATLTLATQKHPLMDVNNYRSGFCKPNDEWIWGIYNDASENIWYYGWQLHMACNGYQAQQGIDACISRTLAESFPNSDIRKGLFLTESTFLPDNGSASYKDVVDGGDQEYYVGAFSNQAAYDKAKKYAESLVSGVPAQNYSYANLKFQVIAQPAVGSQPIFRSSEMLLIQAEANYFLTKEDQAKENLIALNKTSGRDSQYECTKEGKELLTEIKLYRRLELWGEGFSWFDCKRWNEPVVRPGFEDNGNYSNRISGAYGFNKTTGEYDSTFWKWILPGREVDYNSAIKTGK